MFLPSTRTGYWPKSDAPPDEAAWKSSISEFLAHLKGMQDLVADPNSDLNTPFPHGDGANSSSRGSDVDGSRLLPSGSDHSHSTWV